MAYDIPSQHMLDSGAVAEYQESQPSNSPTQKYTHVSMDKLMEIYDKSSRR